MNINEILYLIKHSNLKTNTKSFLSAILKGVENADPDSSEAARIKAQEDALWAQRKKEIAAKKQLEEDAAFKDFENPFFFKKVNNFGTELSRFTPDPDALRTADSTDIDRLNKQANLRKEILATPGRVDPKLGKVELDKATFMQQADDRYDDLSGRFLPFEIEQAPVDPKYALEVIDGPDEEDLKIQESMRMVDEAEKRINFEKLLDSIKE